MELRKFSIGDKVRIINKGSAYSYNLELANKLGAKRWTLGSARKKLNNGDLGVINNLHEKMEIALISVVRDQYLVGFHGLALMLEEENDGRGIMVSLWE